MNYSMIIPVIILIIIGWGCVWATRRIMNQAENDWQVIADLEQKAKLVNTKEEIEELHKEMIEKSKPIYNKYVHARLQKLDGYLRGMYKQYQNK